MRLLLSCLVLPSFCLLLSPLPSSLLSLPSLFLSVSVSLRLCLSLSPSGDVVVLLCCVVLCLVLWCVCGVMCSVECVVWNAEKPVCPFKTCPCVRSKRTRVYWHHAHMETHVRVVPVHTRFDWTHDGEGEGHRQF